MMPRCHSLHRPFELTLCYAAQSKIDPTVVHIIDKRNDAAADAFSRLDIDDNHYTSNDYQ